MTYTAAEVLAILGALATLGGVIVQIIVAVRTRGDVKDLTGQVEEVHAITNSNFSRVTAELATANALNTSLRDLVQDMKSEREKTAIHVALSTPVPVVIAPTEP